jgi:chromosome segregation ATPase
VIVDPGKEATLGVREVMAGTSRLAISDVTEQLIVQLAASGLPAAELERALKPVLDRKAELAAIERRLQSLESLRTAIVQDQQRLRENMKALRGSTEEKELLQRYTRQLNEQENRLESLQQEIAKGTAERESTRSALSAAIGSLSFEIG